MKQPANHSTMENVTPSAATSSFWKKLSPVIVCLFFLVIAAGCTSTELVSREKLVNEKLQRPSKIFIYDFVANPAEVPKDSSFAAHTTTTGKSTPAQTPDAIADGRKLGANIAALLVQEIRDMGLPAEKGSPSSKPQINNIVIRGYLLSVSQGDTVKRVVVGFGYGSSELVTAVEGFQMTAKGLRKLGSAKLKSSGGKSPGGGLGALTMIASANPAGLIVGGVVKGYGEISGNSKVEGLGRSAVKEISEKLKIRFKEEGWIKEENK